MERPGGPPLIIESWTKDEHGQVVRYGLAYIDFQKYSGDNGRVLGHDNAHGRHERHYMGKPEEVDFVSYEQQAVCFFDEVDALRKENA